MKKKRIKVIKNLLIWKELIPYIKRITKKFWIIVIVFWWLIYLFWNNILPPFFQFFEKKEDKLIMIEVWTNISFYENVLWWYKYKNKLSSGYIEYLYYKEWFYIQVVTDSDNQIVLHSVTSTWKKIKIWKVELCGDTFFDFSKNTLLPNYSTYISIYNRWWQFSEVYDTELNNRFIITHNDMWCGKIGDVFVYKWKYISYWISKEDMFRKKTIINTYTITNLESDIMKMIWFWPDKWQVLFKWDPIIPKVRELYTGNIFIQ